MRKNWKNLSGSTRLYDAINIKNEEARVAFYFVFGDTIFCENSSLGLQYSMGDEYNRRRVISKKQNGYIVY